MIVKEQFTVTSQTLCYNTFQILEFKSWHFHFTR